MTKRAHGPLVPLYLAFSPEILLLARCLWHVEDAVRARSLVQADDLPSLARPCFLLLTSADRPIADDPEHDDTEIVRVRNWALGLRPDLANVMHMLECLPFAVLELVSLADVVRAVKWKAAFQEETSFLEDYPALTRWRDVVLRGRRRASPLAIAAAWELEALEAELAGYPRDADAARAKAKEAVARKSA